MRKYILYRILSHTGRVNGTGRNVIRPEQPTASGPTGAASIPAVAFDLCATSSRRVGVLRPAAEGLPFAFRDYRQDRRFAKGTRHKEPGIWHGSDNVRSLPGRVPAPDLGVPYRRFFHTSRRGVRQKHIANRPTGAVAAWLLLGPGA